MIVGLLLALLTISLYNPISRAPFFNYDDDAYVIENPHVRAGLTWNTIKWAFTTTAESNWHPLTWLSHAADVQVFGMNPAGHHYVNVLLHAMSVVLLFLFLEGVTGACWRSAVVALLFAIHPMNVESVAWIAERKNVLSMLLFLFTLVAYAWYVRKPGVARNLWVAMLFTLALMAKPQVITLPFLLLLLDYWPLRRVKLPGQGTTGNAGEGQPISRLILEKLPLFVLSACSAVITLKVQATAINGMSLAARFGNATLAYARYLKAAFWPADMAPLYPHGGSAPQLTYVALALLLLLGVTALAVLRGSQRYLLAGWLWFLGALVPMAGFVQVGVQSMADRYAYIPFLGLFVMLSWGAADLVKARNIPRLVPVLGTGLLSLALAWQAHTQIGYWRDNMTLWGHTLDVTRNNYIAEDGMATALLLQGRTEEAVGHFRNAVRINPQDPFANLNIGTYEQQRGNADVALRHFETVLVLTEDPRVRATALTNAGYIHYSHHDFGTAKRSFDEALRQRGENAQAWLGLGLLAQQGGDLAQAVQLYAKAAQIQPTAVSYLLLVQALERDGQANTGRQLRMRLEGAGINLVPAQNVVDELLREGQ